MIHFKENEFKMGNELVFDMMNSNLLESLDELRERVEEPLIVTSSYRSIEYNKIVGGAENSLHLSGNAVDLSCNNGILRSKIIFNALSLGLTVGVASGFIHVDNRNLQILFTY